MEHGEDWMERGQAFVRTLERPFEVDVANDLFFDRTGKLMADNQRMPSWKFELPVPVNDGVRPTACLR